MTKAREAAIGFFAGLTLTAAVDFAARALAQVQAHERLLVFSDAAPPTLFRVLPMLLVAGACLHAIAVRARRALYLVLCCTLPGHAFWSYQGEARFHEAIAAGHWTAAALSSGVAALASMAVVMLGIPVAFLLDGWLERRSARQRFTPTVSVRPNRAVFAPAGSDGAGSTFACPMCGSPVKFGASHCHSCEERFAYPKRSDHIAP
jgi:hypothetical protein